MSLNKNFAQHIEMGVDRVFTSAQPIPVNEWIAHHLTLDNDDSTVSMVVDGSSSVVRFQHVVPEGKLFILSRVVWSCADLNILYLDWFGFGTQLGNGCVMRAMEPDGITLISEFLHPLKTTLEFAHLAGADVPILAINRGTIPDVMVIRWSLFKAGFVPIFTAGQIIEFVIRDNLENMDHFECVMQGREFDA
jgi:hypothetical protein